MARDLNLVGMTRLAAGRFAAAWLVYGLCEAFAVSVQPGVSALLRGDAPQLIWWAPGVFLAFYALWGLSLGALAGIVLGPGARWLRRPDRMRLDEFFTVLAASSVTIVFSINAILRSGRQEPAHVSKLEIASIVIAGGVIALWALTPGRSRLAAARTALHPWGGIVLLVGLLWLTSDFMGFQTATTPSLAVKGFASLALIVSVLTGSWFMNRPGRTGRAHPRRRAAILMATLTAAMMLLCVYIEYESIPGFRSHNGASARKSSVPVVLIVLDTVRADHLSLYGYHRKTDPNLTRFAKTAVLFRHAIMPGDMTLSSHASMFTGRHVTHHGAHFSTGRLPAGSQTLAEILQESGYTTAATVSNCGWLASEHGLDQGFQYYDARCGQSLFRTIRPFYLREPLRSFVRRRFFRERASWSWRGAREITDESMSLLNRLQGRGSPLFLFVNYMDAHRPIHPPEPYDTLFPGRSNEFDMQRDWSALKKRVPLGERMVSDKEREHLISQYDGAIAYMDDQMGRLFEHLRSLGLYERSLIIVTSDHGESFGDQEHGERLTFGHGDSLYQNSIAVPMLIKFPHQKHPETRGKRVSGVDILPTVLDVLGIPPLPEIGGQSLVAALQIERDLLSESFDKEEGLRSRAVFSGSQKLIAHADGEVELYDLGDDPAEVTNLAREQPQRVESLHARLTTFAAQLTEALAREGAWSEEADDLSVDEIERLRSLGYLN